MSHAVPTALKKLRGNPGKRPMNTDSDGKYSSMTSIGDPPSVFVGNDVAVQEWERLGPVLCNMGLLKDTDLAAFTLYCLAFSRWIQAEENVNKNGIVITAVGASGLVSYKKNPAIQVAETYLSAMLRILNELGFTPASRSKVILPEDKEEDPLLVALSNTHVEKYKPKKKKKDKRKKAHK